MLWRLIRTYSKPYLGSILIITLLQAAQTIASLYLPSLNADIINDGVAQGDIGYIWGIGGVMLAITFAQAICLIGAVFLAARTSMQMGRDLRADIFDKVETFAATEMNHFGAPSLITRNTNDVQQIQMLVFMSFAVIMSAPMMMIGGVFMAMKQDLWLTWILAVIVPVLAIIVAVIMRFLVPVFRGVQKRIDRINGILREQISGIRVIRAFVQRGHEAERFDDANESLTNVQITVGRAMAILFPVIQFIISLSQVGVMWFGGQRVDDGSMAVGGLTAFISYIMQILIAVMMASMMFMFIPRAMVCADRIGEVLDTEPAIADPEQPLVQAPESGLVELNNVTFSYPGAVDPVLHGVSLTAQPGKTTAVIGSTGAGKTTLLNLIPRLYDATEGSVTVGGVDVRQMPQEGLWSVIGLIPQKAYLFSGTIASNLRYGRQDASDEDLWKALEIAQAKSFVEAMPEGLNAPIAQGGTNVSGGQRQRLAIARALVKEPKVYLFDDSFSALDYTTDAKLRAALHDVTRDSSVIVVAQRVSTILHADQIIVLENGRIVGRGTHAELMETCETYKEIVLSQLTSQEAA